VLVAATLAAVAVPVLLAAIGVSVAVCLAVLTAAPLVTIVGYETVGHRHQDEALAAMRGNSR
jgi:hypothetical protein